MQRSLQRRLSSCPFGPSPSSSVPSSATLLRIKPLGIFVALASAVAYGGVADAAQPLPAGGKFVAGSGTITGSQSLLINQSTARGVIDWNSFSIGAGRKVTFDNGSGATLNRVTGGDPSIILGQINATGSVYLINPQGVIVGPSGVVATGGRFVASSLAVDKDAFMQGGDVTLSGNGKGAVINLGKIGSSGGDVILVSRSTALNGGTISAPNGTAEIATGAQVLLHDSAASPQVSVQTGSRGTVTNAGAIRAAQVSLQAADGNVFALAGNSAAIRATGTATRDGHVWLVAIQGSVHANGTISAVNANGSGGSVDTRGHKLDVARSTVQAGKWTLGAPGLSIDRPTATAVAGSLGNGTSVEAQAITGDLSVKSDLQWKGGASLTLAGARNVTVARNATISNAGAGDLTLRADSGSVDNGGSVTNQGKIDWTKSTGIVSALYDMNGSYSAGNIVGNKTWVPEAYSGEKTQVTAYKLINNMADLQRVADDLKGNYALGKDFDAAGTGVTPIGTTKDAAFVGQFDGFGHTIDNFHAHGTAQFTDQAGGLSGLFGVIGTGGVVRNITLTNATASAYYDAYAGLLAAQNYGVIVHASTSGAAGANVTSAAGGLVALNYGTVERSSSSATVGNSGTAGGLVAVNYGTIAQSFATGATGAGTHGSAGGLVSGNYGTISQSYATGSAEAPPQAAGLAVFNGPAGVITESFAAGYVGGIPWFGYGAIALSNDGTIKSNVYWDKTTTTHTAATFAGAGTSPSSGNGLTTAEMSSAASFVGWDFSNTWTIPGSGTHPVLKWETAGK